MKIKVRDYNSRIKIYYNDNDEIDHQVLKGIVGYFGASSTSKNLVKSEEGRDVYRVVLNNKGFYLKRYAYKKLSKRVKNLFREAEAICALKTSLRLKEAGIAVVKPVLALTCQKDLFTTESIFATEEFKGITLEDYLTKYIENHKILKELAKFWAGFFGCKFVHGDSNLTGFMIEGRQNPIITLVDIDHIRKVPLLSWKRILKNLAVLNARTYSYDKQMLSYEDRIFFFREFLSHFDKDIDLDKAIEDFFRMTLQKRIYWKNKA